MHHLKAFHCEPTPNKEIARTKSEVELENFSKKFLAFRKTLQNMPLEKLEKLYPLIEPIQFTRNHDNAKYINNVG